MPTWSALDAGLWAYNPELTEIISKRIKGRKVFFIGLVFN
jgi:hypothetical protein